MPAKVSDIHEISVIIGFKEKEISSVSLDKKYSTFCSYAQKFAKDKINIDKKTFSANEDLFNRGVALSALLKEQFFLKAETLKWSGLEDHKNDSSDVYCDGHGISLKDSSRIVRNNGFEQLLKTFTRSTMKEFKDPFWEFAPSLSALYIGIILKDCHARATLTIKDGSILIMNEHICNFSGTIKALLAKTLDELTSIFTKNKFKTLIKDFKESGNLKDLYAIRVDLVADVTKKVISVLQEGIYSDPVYVGNNFKHLLQYRDIEKLFGFSSDSWNHVGKIQDLSRVSISAKKVYADKSKLTDKTTGLQINIYTDIEITINNSTKKITLQNQLRYKHSTFTCAPEANLHLLKYEDWAIIYPIS